MRLFTPVIITIPLAFFIINNSIKSLRIDHWTSSTAVVLRAVLGWSKGSLDLHCEPAAGKEDKGIDITTRPSHVCYFFDVAFHLILLPPSLFFNSRSVKWRYSVALGGYIWGLFVLRMYPSFEPTQTFSILEDGQLKSSQWLLASVTDLN